MWEIRIEAGAVRAAKVAGEVTLRVSTATLRDDSHGISLAVEEQLVGEWTDSGAVSLVLKEDGSVEVLGADGVPRYRLRLPGTPVATEQLSPSQVQLTLRL